MSRTATISVMALVIFCVSASQILLSFASYTSTRTIGSSGIITENVVEPTIIKKHIVAYVWRFTDETADFVASNFDVVDTGFETAPTIHKIKALNPNIIVLGYQDIMARSTSCEDWEEVNSHEDWFLHDVNGERLIHNYWGWYAMDVGNAGWRTHYANLVKDKLESSLFDGVFADDVWERFSNNKWTVAPSDIPSEIGQRWHNDMVGMISFVKNIIGNKLLIVNTSNDDDYVAVCDGKMEEEFVHPSWYALDEFYDDYIDWKGKVDSLRNLSQSGKYYLAQSGTIVSENPTEAELDKVHDMMIYCFTSYLLGVNGEKATFGFNIVHSDDIVHSEDGSRGYYSEFDVPLGSPVGEYYLIGSVYVRDFANGKVLVNPTASSYTVDLDGEYKTLDGQTASNATLDAHSGAILLNP